MKNFKDFFYGILWLFTAVHCANIFSDIGAIVTAITHIPGFSTISLLVFFIFIIIAVLTKKKQQPTLNVWGLILILILPAIVQTLFPLLILNIIDTDQAQTDVMKLIYAKRYWFSQLIVYTIFKCIILAISLMSRFAKSTEGAFDQIYSTDLQYSANNIFNKKMFIAGMVFYIFILEIISCICNISQIMVDAANGGTASIIVMTSILLSALLLSVLRFYIRKKVPATITLHVVLISLGLIGTNLYLENISVGHSTIINSLKGVLVIAFISITFYYYRKTKNELHLPNINMHNSKK